MALYIASLNDVIDLHSKRVYVEHWIRIPDLVFAALAVLSVLSMLLTGYLLGLKEKRYGLPTLFMIFSYATVFLLVIDLDRSSRGFFQVNQQPMIELRETVQSELAGE